jgi:hypothetical protein
MRLNEVVITPLPSYTRYNITYLLLERILTMVYVEHGCLVSGLYRSSSVQKNKSDKNTTLRRLE